MSSLNGYIFRQAEYSAALASLLEPAPWAGSVNNDRARSPLRTAIKMFLKLFIDKE